MEPSEQNALLGLLGSVYGETKKIDNMIVGESKQLQRVSDGVKQVFTSVMQGRQPPPVQVGTTLVESTPMIPPSSYQNGNNQILIDISQKLDIIIKLLEKKKRSKRKKLIVPKDIENQCSKSTDIY